MDRQGINTSLPILKDVNRSFSIRRNYSGSLSVSGKDIFHELTTYPILRGEIIVSVLLRFDTRRRLLCDLLVARGKSGSSSLESLAHQDNIPRGAVPVDLDIVDLLLGQRPWYWGTVLDVVRCLPFVPQLSVETLDVVLISRTLLLIC